MASNYLNQKFESKLKLNPRKRSRSMMEDMGDEINDTDYIENGPQPKRTRFSCNFYSSSFEAFLYQHYPNEVHHKFYVAVKEFHELCGDGEEAFELAKQQKYHMTEQLVRFLFPASTKRIFPAFAKALKQHKLSHEVLYYHPAIAKYGELKTMKKPAPNNINRTKFYFMTMQEYYLAAMAITTKEAHQIRIHFAAVHGAVIQWSKLQKKNQNVFADLLNTINNNVTSSASKISKQIEQNETNTAAQIHYAAQHQTELIVSTAEIVSEKIDEMKVDMNETLDHIKIASNVTEATCPGCRDNAPNQEAHMGPGGCLESPDKISMAKETPAPKKAKSTVSKFGANEARRRSILTIDEDDDLDHDSLDGFGANWPIIEHSDDDESDGQLIDPSFFFPSKFSKN